MQKKQTGKIWRFWRGCVLAGLVFYVLAPPGAGLAADKTVQLAPLLATAKSYGGINTSFVPIIVQLVLTSEKGARLACAYAPRVRDAVIVHLARQPLRLKAGGKVNLAGVGDQLLAPVQKTIPFRIRQVNVVDGGTRNTALATGEKDKVKSSSHPCVLVVE